MSRYQFEGDLTHLERIIPLLVHGNPLALSRTGGVGFRRYRRSKVCFLTVPGA